MPPPPIITKKAGLNDRGDHMGDTTAVTSTTPNAIVTTSAGHPFLFNEPLGNMGLDFNLQVPILDSRFSTRISVGTMDNLSGPQGTSLFHTRLGVSLGDYIPDNIEKFSWMPNLGVGIYLEYINVYTNTPDDNCLGWGIEGSFFWSLTNHMAVGITVSGGQYWSLTTPKYMDMYIEPALSMRVEL